MRRALSLMACMTGASAAVALAILSPTSTVVAAGTDAGAAAIDAGSDAAAMSIYLLKAGTGTVLPPSVDDAEAFCALALACQDVAFYPPAPDFSGCVQALMDELTIPSAINASLAIRDCGLSATSCKRLRACALKGANPADCAGVAMTSAKPIGKCDLDGRAITCWKGKVLGVRDCSLGDEICSVNDGQADCALAGGCPASAKADWTCASTRMVKCQNNNFVSVDCKVMNLACVSGTDASGKAVVGCAPPGGVACKGDKVTCSGTSAIGCVYGKEVKVACGDQGMTCGDPLKPTDQSVGVCEMPVSGTPCDPKKFTSSCKGSAIEYCSHGMVRSFQCKAIGATKCVLDKGTGPRCTA